MPRTLSQGPFRYVAQSWASMLWISVPTILRRSLRGPLAPGWPIGNLFWRSQFDRAFAMADIRKGRVYFDSLQTWTDEVYDVERSTSSPGAPKGNWVSPPELTLDATLLYLHGGGYAFHAGVSRRFADMLASLLGARLFVPDYRLTPEQNSWKTCSISARTTRRRMAWPSFYAVRLFGWLFHQVSRGSPVTR